MDRLLADRLAALLHWYVDMGVDETTAEQPVNRLAVAPRQPLTTAGREPDTVASRAGSPASPGERRLATAVNLAARAESLDQLRQALVEFDGCALKATATHLVFGDGNLQAKIVLIGEAPGAEEDRLGIPFVGPSGRLLDRMLASIGLDRTAVFISNTVFWRPPGNRAPLTSEVAACMPFVERMIELISPEMLLLLGGPAATALLGHKESVGKLRGRWFNYQTPRLPRPIAARVLFHPAYLLRSPAQKRAAWHDLLAIKQKLDQR
jgi:DNA polymerase